MTVQADAPAAGARARGLLALGPAFVAAVAYVDPGNVAANTTAGAQHGYLLVWVLVAAGVMGALVQYCSARLGLVTGASMPDLLGRRLRRPARLAYWAQAELVAAATDIAEVIGGAIALRLLFGLPLPLGGAIVGVAALVLLTVQSRRRQRWFEAAVVTLLVVLALGFVAGLVVDGVDWRGVAGGLAPRFGGPETVVLATSMLGATVMPHVIYLHSALVRDRNDGAVPRASVRPLLAATRWDVGIALSVAGLVNIALLVLAAGSARGAEDIDGVFGALADGPGAAVAVLFAVGLLASGLASTSVGAYAGAVIMSGLLAVRVPLLLRRSVTLVPALLLLAIGVDPTATLVISQVVLSLGVPFALVPLLRLNGDPAVMGEFAAGRTLRTAGWVVTALVVALNAALLVLLAIGA